MLKSPTLDPAPRSYPPGVKLVRRADVFGRKELSRSLTVAEIEKWLLGEAIKETDLLVLFQAFMTRLISAGLLLDRVSLHVGTLHPELIGFGWHWNRSDGFCDEIQVSEAVLGADAYRRNPLFRVIEFGEEIRCKTEDTAATSQYPLIRELAEQGITEYLVEPIGGGPYHNAVSLATKTAGGFTDEEVITLKKLLAVFALHVERHIQQRIGVNVLDTYLGRAAGQRVLNGSIQRGAGEAINAIIWISDLRNFTDLTDRLPGPEMISLLNVYFEILAGAVLEHGGEVSKFIGDGLLAVFPLAAAEDDAAAHMALAAARQAIKAIGHLNQNPPVNLAGVNDWGPLRTGIALHEGDVFFGNVGAPARLDFTVIGRAVNAASRVEGLCKTLGHPIIVTEPVARRLRMNLESLGAHALRGLAEPLTVYSAD